jgi:hypothetical protein
VSERSCSSQYKCSVSKASQRTFGLSTGALFASNDSKTSRKKWPLIDNWDDSLKTNIWPQQSIFRPQQSNFVCSNDKFVADMGQGGCCTTHSPPIKESGNDDASPGPIQICKLQQFLYKRPEQKSCFMCIGIGAMPFICIFCKCALLFRVAKMLPYIWERVQ